jgi:hypothetical protein
MSNINKHQLKLTYLKITTDKNWDVVYLNKIGCLVEPQ